MVISELNKKSIIDPIKLAKIINSNQLKIIDCRWYLKDVKLGKRDYKKSHIPNAIFFDIEKYQIEIVLYLICCQQKNYFYSSLKIME